MRVLIVCRHIKFLKKSLGYEIAPFIKEQVDELNKLEVETEIFLIRNHGIIGYLRHLIELRAILKEMKYDIVHAHGGHIGSICCIQRRVPIVVTFHGSDINNKYTRLFSKIAMYLSDYNIFVNKEIAKKVKAKSNYSVIPCGVNLNTFYPIKKSDAREKLGWNYNQKIILFSGTIANPIKNFILAEQSLKNLINNVRIIELNGYSRDKVNLLLNACDLLLLTSKSEGSPQIVKEALATNCPIVSTDVGDIKELIGNIEGCFITTFEKVDINRKVKAALEMKKRIKGRDNITHLNVNNIAKKIYNIYYNVFNNSLNI